MVGHEHTPIMDVEGAIPAIEPLPFALIDEPLEYIFADHFRERCICLMLRRFAGARRASRTDADVVIAFLTQDLPVHHADEEVDLFPLLRKRVLPEDALSKPLATLSADHRDSEVQVEAIVGALAASQDCDPLPIGKEHGEAMLAYAASEYRHLALENGIVLAIARIRLTRGDLKALSRGMKSRRVVPN